MDTSQTLFLTKEQVKKKGNGIHLTQEQLNWLRGITNVSPGSCQQEQCCNECKQEEKKEQLLTISVRINKDLIYKMRTFCFQNSIPIRSFIETAIKDSKFLENVTEINFGVGNKKNNKSGPQKEGRYRKLYEEMRSKGFITRDEAAKILGVADTTVLNFMKKGLPFLSRGRFSFFIKSDVEKFLEKKIKNKLK